LLPGVAATWTSTFPFALSKGPLPASAHPNAWLYPKLAARGRDDGPGNGRRIRQEMGEAAEVLKSLIARS